MRNLFKYQRFDKTKDINGTSIDWKQSFINAGIKMGGFGGGLCFSSIEGSSGTGLYLELCSSKPGALWGIKADIVSLEGAAAGGVSIYFGYSFGMGTKQDL